MLDSTRVREAGNVFNSGGQQVKVRYIWWGVTFEPVVQNVCSINSIINCQLNLMFYLMFRILLPLLSWESAMWSLILGWNSLTIFFWGFGNTSTHFFLSKFCEFYLNSPKIVEILSFFTSNSFEKLENLGVQFSESLIKSTPDIVLLVYSL